MSKTAIVTPKAPAAIGPYSQGIAAGSPPDMLVNNMVREFFAEIKFLL